MAKSELKQTKGNSTHGKKTDKGESSATSSKPGGSTSKSKKDRIARQREEEEALENSESGSASDSGSGSGSDHRDSEEGSGSDEGRDNSGDGDRRKPKRKARSQPNGEDLDEVEVKGKGEGRAKVKRKQQGGTSKRGPLKPKVEPRAVRQLRALDVKDSLKIRLDKEVEPIYQATRVLVRNITEHCNPHRLLIDGLVMTNLSDQAHRPSEVHDDFNDMVLSEMLWPQVCKWLPQIEEYAEVIAPDSNLVCQISDYISGVAKKTRSDDLPRVKAGIIDIVDIKDTDRALRDKAARGFNNIATGRLLCPASDVDEFDEDPSQYCRLARAGKKIILSEDWFTLCYDEKLRNAKEPKAGLFRNMAGVKCYKLIFTGRGSAMDEFIKSSHKGKIPIATKAKLEKVTIGSIIYIHLLMRFTLNSQVSWDKLDGANWDGAAFARSIFDAAFESPKSAEELENWKVFGRGQDDTEDLHLKRKSTVLALFKEQSERSIQRRSQLNSRHEIEDGANQAHTKKSSICANDEELTDNASSMSNNHGREDDCSSAHDDSGCVDENDSMIEESGQARDADQGIVTIAGLAKRDVDSEVTDSGEPPAKRPRPRPRKRTLPTSSSDADTASPQITTRDQVDEMYANSE